jgi:hypothetical protein
VETPTQGYWEPGLLAAVGLEEAMKWYRIVPAAKPPLSTIDAYAHDRHLAGNCEWNRCGLYISEDSLTSEVRRLWDWHGFEPLSEDEEIVARLEGTLKDSTPSASVNFVDDLAGGE